MQIRFNGGFKELTGNLLGDKVGAHTIQLAGVSGGVSLAAGLLPGASIVNKFGLNPDIDTTTTSEDVWGGGGLYTGFPDIVPERVAVFSSNANDTELGTGARSVQLTGLDANWNILNETVTLNGTTPVITTNTFRRVHTARTVSAGSAGWNLGDITFRYETTTSVVFLSMLTGKNQTNNISYTVPAGYTGYLIKVTASCRLPGTATDYAVGNLWIRNFGEVFRSRRPFVARTDAPWIDEIEGAVVLPEKSDITMRITNVAASNTEVVGSFDIVLINSDLFLS